MELLSSTIPHMKDIQHVHGLPAMGIKVYTCLSCALGQLFWRLL